MKTRSIPVRVGGGYEVAVGAGLLEQSGALLRGALGDCRLAVVSDETVARLYAPRLLASLRGAGYEAVLTTFPAGEANKRLATVEGMLEFFAEARFTRGDCVVALGGGVAGDMAGFAAGVYLRGVRFVQIPTTLLAAVDSSVGGKTGVDLAAGKNLAGVFHQPELVVCDTDCLLTLPPEQFACGAAEAIKTAMLGDAQLFEAFETGRAAEDIGDVIARCVTYKARVVEADERESGMRKLLNLGHTLGHAIEKASGYTILHGQAIAVGLAAFSRAAERLGTAREPISARVERVLRQSNLPVDTEFSPETLYEAALSDKKRIGGTITVVLPRRIGECELQTIPVEELLTVFRLGLGERT